MVFRNISGYLNIPRDCVRDSNQHIAYNNMITQDMHYVYMINKINWALA